MWRNRAIEKKSQLIELLSGNVDAMFLNRLQVRHLMSELVETASPNMPVQEVAALMARTRMRHLPVCQGYRQLVGIISDRDLHSRRGSAARDIMTSETVSVQHTTPLVEAIDFMLAGNFSCLPVFKGDFLCGIVTTADVILAMRCSLEVFQQKMQELQRHSGSQPQAVPLEA